MDLEHRKRRDLELLHLRDRVVHGVFAQGIACEPQVKARGGGRGLPGAEIGKRSQKGGDQADHCGLSDGFAARDVAWVHGGGWGPAAPASNGRDGRARIGVADEYPDDAPQAPSGREFR